MPNAIYALSDNAIIALLMTLVVGGDVLAALVYQFFSRAWLPPGSTGSILDAYRVVVTLTALVLAFSLVQAQDNIFVRPRQYSRRKQVHSISRSGSWNTLAVSWRRICEAGFFSSATRSSRRSGRCWRMAGTVVAWTAFTPN